jgi:hypothetical protein
MRSSRLLRNALVVAFLTLPLAAQATMRITDVDLSVPAAPGGRRAPDPSHKVFVGDLASINVFLWHDGNVQGWSTSWSTTAPVTGLTQHAPQTGLLTANSSPFTHRLPVGAATFTTPGRYKIDVSVHSQSGDASASFDIEVDEIRAVVAPVSVACLAPAVRWESPFANGAICQDKETTLRAAPTFHGCEPHTMEFLVPGKLAGTWAVIGTRTAAPWSITHTFTANGPVHLKVLVKDKNGATAESEITATVGPCLDASKFKH